MAKKSHIKVRLVPEAKQDSAYFYYAKKPTKGEKAKNKLKLKKYNDARDVLNGARDSGLSGKVLDELTRKLSDANVDLQRHPLPEDLDGIINFLANSKGKDFGELVSEGLTGTGNFIKNTCLTAPIASPERNGNLYKEYEALTSENKGLIAQAEKIFQKIQKLNSLNGNLDMKMKSTRAELQDNLDEYSTIYSKLLSNKKYGITTLNGQVEDIDLKEKNQMLQLGIWGSLAVLLVLVTLDRLRK